MKGDMSFLKQWGLLNVEAPHIAEITGEECRDKKATFCNGACARGSTSARGVVVTIDTGYPRQCPFCGSEKLLFDMITPKEVKKYLPGLRERKKAGKDRK